jgi:hypothetical protein
MGISAQARSKYHETIHFSFRRDKMDCFASLAMTLLAQGIFLTRHCEERSDEAIHSFFPWKVTSRH